MLVKLGSQKATKEFCLRIYEDLIYCDFCAGFFPRSAKKVPANKNYHKILTRRIYSVVKII